MRTIGLLALLAVGLCLSGDPVGAQSPGAAPAALPPGGVSAVQATKPAAPQAATIPAGTLQANAPQAAVPKATVVPVRAGQAAADLAGRPDAFRYYWHDGQWWYFTAQNTWLRWNGSAWVQHHSINDSGAFNQGIVPQPNAGNMAPDNVYAPGYDNGGNAAPTYRYDINRRKGGL